MKVNVYLDVITMYNVKLKGRILIFGELTARQLFHRAFLSGNLESNCRKCEFQLNDAEFLESTRVPDKKSRVSTRVRLEFQVF